VSVSQVRVSLSAQQAQVLGLVLPHLSGTVVDRAEVSGGLVSIWVHAAAGGAACPDCGTWCTAVRDRYRRRLRDAAAGGRRVLIWLVVRLLRCGNAQCPRASFAEQPQGLAVPYARRTPLLAGQLGAVAAALAGRAGSRLARAVLAVEVSRHTLVRVLMAVPEPAAGLVRVLGIDDFSLRKGQAYATLLVDMETGRPVDVLPDREQATVEEWLRAHPGAEVICRDRGGAYAAAVRAAAPGAVQVADRWHLWHNLCEYAGKAVARHRECAVSGSCACQGRPQDQRPQDQRQEDQQQQQEQQQQQQEEEQEEEEGDGVPAGLEAIVRERYAAVRELRAAGKTQDEAAAALGLSRQTAGRFWRAASAQALLKTRGTSALNPYKPYLRRRWDQGITSIAALHREITALGYAGSEPTTYAWLALLKLAAPAEPPAPPAARQISRWMLTDPARLGEDEQAQLAAALGRCPDLHALAGHVTEFAKMLTSRPGGRLDSWLAAAGAHPALASFANGIRHDHQAVRNALTLEWNSGRVEGLNTRTKQLQRQMYGRASFPLLRKRILASQNTAPLPPRNMRQSPPRTKNLSRS
jgi:transposase